MPARHGHVSVIKDLTRDDLSKLTREHGRRDVEQSPDIERYEAIFEELLSKIESDDDVFHEDLRDVAKLWLAATREEALGAGFSYTEGWALTGAFKSHRDRRAIEQGEPVQEAEKALTGILDQLKAAGADPALVNDAHDAAWWLATTALDAAGVPPGE